MSWNIQAAIAAKIGFATHQNSIPIVRELAISASGDAVGQHLKLSLVSDPPFLQSKTWRFDAVAAGDTLHVSDRDIALNAALLQDLSESLVGSIKMILSDSADQTLAELTHPVELLAHNQWGGIGSMAELLPAFVMPNDPAVDRVLKEASNVLRRAGKSDAIDGYRSGKRDRVWELASAIWSSIAGLRISYALPPASFEQSGQKIRTPSQILDGRLATCLDTALLFAATLEQASLNPLLVLTQGHAFVGVWLQPVEFAALCTDEAAALRRRVDVDDLVVFETTLVTQATPASFGQAISIARRQIDEDVDAQFEMAIDVRRGRLQKVRPLGVAVAVRDSGNDAPLVSEGLEPPPNLPPFDIDVDETAPTSANRIIQWQRKLLNLTTSNNLLSLRDSKSVVKLLCPDPGALEDLLASGKKVRIAPMPDLEIGGRDEKLYEQRTQTNLREEVAHQAMSRGEALSLLPKDKLDAALIELYRKARNDMEEGGSNTLYLALGFLKWKKSSTEEKTYRAPLILLPVRLDRKNALSGVTMSAHEDEPRFNLTLLELLRQDFELSIAGLDGELPKDESGIDVAGIWRLVRTAVRDMAGFEVVPEVVVGTFSFAKYLMWKDLVDRADRLKESPLVRHLIDRDGSVEIDKGEFPRAEEMDAKVDPAQLFTPLPADSSQLTAVVASAEGRDFVLDGPPGTGKSQTIANMIAHNLALGRRVLFVAEKRAALEVVHRRLADKGLAPFCLELHSSKATKSAVLKQLDDAWTTRDTLTAAEWEREATETKKVRDELNGVVTLLHRREDNGWTIHRAIGRTVRDASENTPKFTFPPSRSHSSADMVRLRDVVRRLGIARQPIADLPKELNSISRTDWTNHWQDEISINAAEVPDVIRMVQLAQSGLEAATQFPSLGTARHQIGDFLSFAELCLSTHGHDLQFAFAPDASERINAARNSLDLITKYQAEERVLSAIYAPEAARRIDVDAIRNDWQAAGQKVLFLSTLAKKKVTRALSQLGGTSGSVDVEKDLPRIAAMRELLAQIDTLSPQAAAIPGWAGLLSQRDQVERVIGLSETLRASIATQASSPAALIELRRATATLVIDANDMLAIEGPISAATSKLRSALESFDEVTGRFNQLSNSSPDGDLAALRDKALAVTAHSRRLKDWADWRRVREEAIQAELASLVDSLENGAIASTETVNAFETAYARWFAYTRIDQEPLLTHFMAGEHEDRIARFRALDQLMGELASRYIRAKLCGKIPNKNDVGKKDGYGTLKHQLQLQRPSMPIRKLAAEMGDAFTRLAPCMLMSPLSIAQYLPADQALFDLVIFDEASQITPWDAIGAMARGRQVVIAGDPRQMPPSNDFARGSGTATVDDDTASDLDSVLEECLAAGVPQHSLDWHYRSRHESLITFSNTRYYKSQLVTFPPPQTKPSAVSWQRVPGVYTAGSRTNPIEAQAIVEEAVRRLCDPGFVDENGKPLTLGIITMNAEQMRLVEDLLDRAQRAHPEITPHFDQERLEPVCVRNLETVQGDERDVILLGVNFGPSEPSGNTMSMAFGKLNSSGGWRRLNVATTRARREMKVFTSFDPGMIDLTRTAAEGVRDLKAFIEFAERGPRALAEATKGSMGGADSPFEEAVTAALRRRGWTTVPQVGVSKFRIDLGIVHPDRPGDYLVGVECDGASYHSAATARDRDRIRAVILEGLGWKLVRIWSTDWWIDKDRAANKLHLQIDAILAADREAAAQKLSVEPSPASDENATSRESDGPLEKIESDAPAEILGNLAIERSASHSDEDLSEPGAITISVSEPVFARAIRSDTAIETKSMEIRYRATSFDEMKSLIDPEQFYDATYDSALSTLIEHVLSSEAPIAEGLLVQRIARAHGFQRTGPVIRDRVMSLTRKRHVIEQEPDGRCFVWSDEDLRVGWVHARLPATIDDIRQIEDIALVELRLARVGKDSVEVARGFGVRRLTAMSKARIESA